MSPVVYTLVAPYLPSSAANESVSPPQVKASTVEARLRAAVSSSRLMVSGLPSKASARTQILLTGIGLRLPSAATDGRQSGG